MKKFAAIVLSLLMVLTLVACGGSNTTTEAAKTVYKITYANTTADANPQAINAKWLAERAKELSNGQLEITVFNNNKLGAFSDCFAQMQLPTGTVQMGDVSPASVTQFSTAFTPYSLPFLFKNAQQSFDFFDKSDSVKKSEEEFLKETNVRVLGYFYNDARALTNGKKAVATPDDMKGLKLRVMTSDVYIKTFESLGAAPVGMQFSELFSALQTGTVDGQDNGLILSMDSKFNEVQKYYTDLGHVQDTSVIFISEEFWKTLPEDLQKALQQAVDEAVAKERQEYLNKLDSYLTEMKKTMEVTILTDAQRQAFKDACQPVYDWYRGEFSQYDIDAIMADIAKY
ncbi:MAG: TRAP transporter substrate-binding protein [Lachnospiraceae bacterium]|nr:TRAP transporter substrate-binding protein [Lachnospiraceae bacterium]